MEPQDHPARHFRLMAEVAELLKALPAQVLAHDYSYESFGSWRLSIRHRGVMMEVTHDGRDGQYAIRWSGSRKPPYQWTDTGWSYRPVAAGIVGASEIATAVKDVAQQVLK